MTHHGQKIRRHLLVSLLEAFLCWFLIGAKKHQHHEKWTDRETAALTLAHFSQACLGYLYLGEKKLVSRAILQHWPGRPPQSISAMVLVSQKHCAA